MNITELYIDIEKHLINDHEPSIYLNEIYYFPIFSKYPFDMFYNLKKTDQSAKHHPEGNVWIHTTLVVNEAAKLKSRSKDPKALMWAALLHDIGKPHTTKKTNGRITSYNHDIVGSKLSKEFLSKFNRDEEFIEKVTQLVRYHMQILFVVNNMSFADIDGMKQNTDVGEVALLGLSDRLGRGKRNRILEEKNISLFLQKCIQRV